jgi:hypothetical protein
MKTGLLAMLANLLDKKSKDSMSMERLRTRILFSDGRITQHGENNVQTSIPAFLMFTSPIAWSRTISKNVTYVSNFPPITVPARSKP